MFFFSERWVLSTSIVRQLFKSTRQKTISLQLIWCSTFCAQVIHYLGGRYFWIHSTGPIGCLPYVLVRVPDIAAKKDKVGCGEVFNEVAQLFNAKLKETVAQLRKDLPSATFTYVDVYTAKYEMFKNPAKHGKHGEQLLQQ